MFVFVFVVFVCFLICLFLVVVFFCLFVFRLFDLGVVTLKKTASILSFTVICQLLSCILDDDDEAGKYITIYLLGSAVAKYSLEALHPETTYKINIRLLSLCLKEKILYA